MLKCRSGHPVGPAKVKPWQGRIHERACDKCERHIDRKEDHFSCSKKCQYYLCEPCFHAESVKLQNARSKFGQFATGVVPAKSPAPRPGASPESQTSTSVSSTTPAAPVAQGQHAAWLPADAVAARQPLGAQSSGALFSGPGEADTRTGRLAGLARAATTSFSESAWQESVEAAFWVAVILLGDFFVAARVKELTTDPDLQFPYPWTTACLSALVACLLCTAILRAFGPILEAQDVQMDLRFPLALGVMLTLQVGSEAKVLDNMHHTSAIWLYMLTPLVTFFLASRQVVSLEVYQPQLAAAAGMAAIGGILSARSPPPRVEGLWPLGWSALTVVLMSCRCVLTQKIVAPQKLGQARPSPVVVAQSMLAAAATVGVELSLVYEWHGVWSLFDLPNPSKVFGLILAIGIFNALVVVADTRLIQITSATFATILIPFHAAALLPGEAALEPISDLNWVGLLLCLGSAVVYFKARNRESHGADPPGAGYADLPGR
mmetsp:Transcript_86936/g.156593  ORF Transcript_86936/g.156593 Transcript_86936/m.156593 type:complete len:491 (-) Transcript_86936:58-1530(-)